jgi:hypothetical protein
MGQQFKATKFTLDGLMELTVKNLLIVMDAMR